VHSNVSVGELTPDTDSAMTLAPFGFSSAPPSNQLHQ
jgi:hypothetical protein